jgi:hypothetical protein
MPWEALRRARWSAMSPGHLLAHSRLEGAVFADVRANGADAVRVELEHQEGTALVVLVPYNRSRLKKKVTLGQISGGMGRPHVWTAD